MKKAIISIKYLIIILLYFFAIEILSRIFIWGVTADPKAFGIIEPKDFRAARENVYPQTNYSIIAF